MFSNLKSWLRKQSLKKLLNKAGKQLAGVFWEQIVQLVTTAEHSGLPGPEKLSWVRRELLKKLGIGTLVKAGTGAQTVDVDLSTVAIPAWVNTAINLAVSLLDSNLIKAVNEL